MGDLIDSDGLPASDVGIWTLEKHERLRKYVDSAHGARRQFKNRTTYVDLYCGPGRSRIRETGEYVDGSPLVAWEAGGKHGDQFAEFFLADSNPAYLSAARQRLEKTGAKVRTFPGVAEDVVDQVIAALDQRGLHLALLDPFRLGDLPFSVIERLAGVKRMDLLIHVSAMDLKRDLHNYLRTDGPKHLDRFAPGWRDHVDTTQRPELVRVAIFEYWKGLLKRLGTSANECVEAVENRKSSELYWLVFVARHGLAHKLWAEIANVTPQGRLFG
ncbi:MAG TPA: three-Cys-motif partner protein TcmP [Burkholderiales bacterium]|nr:three-Cys-motif partner protein TcmP [Burkholderiales bacterium]